MFSSLVVVTLALTSQVSATDQRYQNTPASQPSAVSPAPGTGGTPGTIKPLTGQGAPAASGAAQATTPAPNGTSPYAPNRPNFSSQPSTTTFTPGTIKPITGQSQQPATYPGQTGFPATESASASSQQTPSKSSVMMRAMLTPPTGSQLRGDSVSLIEVVSSGRTRNEQTQRIEAYWDLCSAVADYYLSVREQEELRGVTPAAAMQSDALREAAKKMAIRSQTSLQAARASQYRLASFTGRGPSNLPLPADIPHCGTYTSRYDQVFAGRSSPEAQGLAELFPMRYAELDDAVVRVAGAEDWLRGVMSRNENSDAVGNLRALELLALQRRAFVQIARDYNRRIARYSELATPGQVNPDRLTGMLIRRGTTSASAPPVRASGGVEQPPRTFANTSTSDDDWLPPEKPSLTGGVKVDPAVQPASATQSTENREHSVVVPPR